MNKFEWAIIAIVAMLLLNEWTGSKIGVPEAIILALIGVLVWRVWGFFAAISRAVRRY